MSCFLFKQQANGRGAERDFSFLSQELLTLYETACLVEVMVKVWKSRGAISSGEQGSEK